MKESEFKKIVLKYIEKKVKDLKKIEWDSLAHLSILMDLEKKFPNKITSIKKVSDATSYKSLLQLLKKKNIINSD
jgi:acyl carrier protein